MTDLTEAGRRRTDLAMRIVRDCDFEASGQLPATHKTKPGLAIRAAKATGRATGKGCLYGAKYAGKGAWAATKWIFSPSRSSRTVTVIIKDERCGVDDTVLALILIVLALGFVGILAGA